MTVVSTRRGRAPLTSLAVVAILTALVGTASAQTLPSPSAGPVEATTPSPGSTTGEPAAPDPLGAGVETPAPVGPAPGARPAPSTTSTPTPAPRPTAAPVAPVRAVTAPADGVAPSSGQVDDYLVASAARDDAASLVERLVASLRSAETAVAGLEEGRRALAMTTARAQLALLDAQGSADDVVRDLYQQGDAGIGAFATILASGPEGLLDRVDNARMAVSTAYGVVDRTDDARLALALAVAAVRAHDDRTTAARRTQTDVQQRLDAARRALATAEARLVVLGSAAPQVAIGVDGCPTVDVPATLRDGADRFGAAALCRSAVHQAATPQAALALTWAFQHLGTVYACKGVGRMQAWRADCSSLVSRAYAEGAGLATARADWAPSTRNMVPWDGVALDPHYAAVTPAALRPGDLVLYDTCPQGGCPYKHVVMYLGSPDGGRTRWMLHTNSCGDVAKVTPFWGFPVDGHPFLVARRIVALPGERVRSVAPATERVAATTATRRATALVAQVLGTG